MRNIMSIIYKVTNLTNGMVYIGRSNKTLEEAWTTHRYEGKQKNPVRLIGQVIKEFGIENFACEVIEECTEDQTRARHQHWMNVYQSKVNGYNKQHHGGNRINHDDVLLMYSHGMTAAEIAKILHCDERTIINHVKAESPDTDIKEITHRTGRHSSVPTILKLWADGKTHIEIAEEINLNESYVRTKLRANGICAKDIYTRLGIPMPDQCRRYEYAQVDVNEHPVEDTDTSSVVAARHEISRTSLHNACTGPATHAKGKAFRRFDEDGVMVPRLCEPVGHSIPVKCSHPDNPDVVYEYASLTAAVVALVGSKDTTAMARLRHAAATHTLCYDMYWYIEERDSRRRPIYAFSVSDYTKQELFMTQGEAARFLHVHQNSISRCLNYPQKYYSAGGYILSWDESFSRDEWEVRAKRACPSHSKCKEAQIKKQDFYLTSIHKYETTYCSTLLDVLAKTGSNTNTIRQCLRGESKTAKEYFVTDTPMTYEEWEVRASTTSDNCKPVYGINVNTKAIITATSIGDAAKQVSVHRHSISYALRNNRVCAGYEWHYGAYQSA